MSWPRLLLVPEFTELAWAVRPQIEAWADVASYDPPGVGDEPALAEGIALTHEQVARRGRAELDRRGWDRAIVVADGWAIATAAHIAGEYPDRVTGLVLGHASLSFRRHGDRPAKSQGVWEALTQLLRQDHQAFITHAIAQTTGGSVGEDHAEKMLQRFPRELIVAGWERLTAEDEDFADLLTELECPLLLVKHEGCLMSTEEGFEDAVAALPKARAATTQDAPQASTAFVTALRVFCNEIWREPGGKREATG